MFNFPLDFLIDVEECPANGNDSRIIRRWDDNELDGRLLENLVNELRNRYSHRTQTLQEPDFLHIQQPSVDDPIIFRVRVKVRFSFSFHRISFYFIEQTFKDGRERDVVFGILQKCNSITTESDTAVISAFSRDGIQGSVYVEVTSAAGIKETLTGLKGVYLHHNSPQINLVPIEERTALLEMDKETTIQRNSWVCILRGGCYKRDLAIVKSIDRCTLNATVLVVPRIHLSKKRDQQGRAKQKLFDVHEVKRVYGEHSVRQERDMFYFKGRTFVHGMMIFEIELYHLSDRSVNVENNEVNYFLQTREKWIVDAVNQGLVKLQVSDKVKVVAGPFQGFTGRLVNIENHNTVVFESEDLPSPQSVRTWEVQKIFIRGDFVHVVCGDFKGSEGFIVDIDDKYAYLYSIRNPNRQYAAMISGEEVCLQLFHESIHKQFFSQLKIEKRHIEYAKSSEILRTTMSIDRVIKSTHNIQYDEWRTLMHTGDPYVGMEVKINIGEGKLHGGVVIQMLEREELYIVVKTTTRLINTTHTLKIDDVTEAW